MWRRRESNPYGDNTVTLCWRMTSLPNRFAARVLVPSIESPGVPLSPLQSTCVVETFWRRKCRLETQGTIHDVRPGYLAAMTASWPIVDGAGKSPFVLGSLTAGMSHVTTTERTPGARAIGLTAIDARLGVAVGKTLGPASPYLLARAFGGPVLWKYADSDVTGTDRHHYQLGLGLVVKMPAHIDLSAEFVPIGEKALAVSTGRAF